jgi:hypothetical protein
MFEALILFGILALAIAVGAFAAKLLEKIINN